MNETQRPELDRLRVLRQQHKLLEAMASPKRLHILELLVSEEISVGELAIRIGMSQSALSQHLAKLHSAGIVTARRHAQTRFYSCKSEPVAKVLKMLATFFGE